MVEEKKTFEMIERYRLGFAILEYLEMHKPDGKDVDKFGEELMTYLELLVAHYEFHIKKLLEMKEQLIGYGAKGWYQKHRKKNTIKMVDNQIKEFKGEIASINEMMARI